MVRNTSAYRTQPVLLSALLASTMLTGIAPAFAQQNTGGDQIETVMVTAEKREENLQRVPIAMQAFSAEKLDQLNSTTFTQYIQYMPSVNFTVGGAGGGNGGPGFDNVFMRGVNSGNDGNHSGSLPTVGIYLDEQPITTIGGSLDIPTYDISRVEVLEGPQGTLYGASSEAGTIRIITNRPDSSAFEAGYSAEVNTVAHGNVGYNADGFVNIPITDHAAIRIVAWDEHDAGYIDNVPGTRTYLESIPPNITINNFGLAKKNFNDVDKMGARAALRVDLNDSWSITPSLMAEQEKSNGVFGYDPSVGYLDVQHYFPEFVHDGWYQAALTIQGKISDFDLTYAGGYMDRRVNAESDYTDYSYWYDTLYPASFFSNYFTDNSGNLIAPSQYILEKDHFTKDSQELRISSPKDARFRVTAGVFYERQTHTILQDYKIPNLADATSVPGWANTIWLTDQLRVDQDEAAYGEAAFDIMPNLTLTGGLRYFQAHNTLYGFFGFNSTFSSHTGVALCSLPQYAGLTPYKGGPCVDLNAGVQEHGFTHKLNLAWRIDDDRMVYATWSTGFRPGGVNRRSDVPPYTSDTLTNYELGWKTSWFDNSLQFDGDVYWENWKSFQFSFLGVNSFTEIHNAGNATIKGIEADLIWKPVDGLTLSAAGNADDAQLQSDFCGPVVSGVIVNQCPGPLDGDQPQAPKGQQLPMDPKYKANATARYEKPLGTWLGYLQGSAVYQSSQWPDLRDFTCDPYFGCAPSGGVGATGPGSSANLPVRTLIGRIPASTTFNFTMGVNKDNWTLEFFVSNLFDEHSQLYRYAECASQVCGREPYVIPGQPRTIGLKFEQKF